MDASIVRLWNGRIYIQDCFSQTKGFFVFNLEGKYLGRIGTVGAWLGEYIMPMGMVIDPMEKRVIVKDVAQNKLLFFDAESFTFLKEERLSFYSDCLEYAASGKLVWYNGAGCKNEGTFQNHLQLTDMEANLLDSRIAQMDFPRRAPYNVLTYFHRYDDLIYFHHPFMNEFYQYNPADKTLQPAYTLTFEKLKMPSEEFIIENKNSIIEALKKENYVQYIELQENSEKILCYLGNGERFIGVYDKKSQEAFYCDFKHLEDDLDIQTYVRPKCVYEDRFVGVIYTEKLEGLPKESIISPLVGNESDGGNPIIVLFK